MKKAVDVAKKEARAELKNKAKEEATKTQEALEPLRTRMQDLVAQYENSASFEHARRMDKLLHSLLRSVEIGCQEATKDLAKIAAGGRPNRPSVLRQRLSDHLWDSQ